MKDLYSAMVGLVAGGMILSSCASLKEFEPQVEDQQVLAGELIEGEEPELQQLQLDETQTRRPARAGLFFGRLR